MNILGVGSLEILVILVVAMLVLGPTRIVEYGRSLGRISRELRRMSRGIPLTLEQLLEGREEQVDPSQDSPETSHRLPEGSKPRPRPRQSSPKVDTKETEEPNITPRKTVDES